MLSEIVSYSNCNLKSVYFLMAVMTHFQLSASFMQFYDNSIKLFSMMKIHEEEYIYG